MANNLRGLTEEEAERAASQAIVTRYGVTSETVTDVLQAKKELLRHSGMLEFIDASENLSSVGGLDNLKRWLAPAARHMGRRGPRLWSGAAARSHHSRSAGLRQEHVRPRHRRRMEAAAGEVRYRRHLRQVHRRNRKADPESISRRRRTCALRVLDRRTGEDLCRKRAGFGLGRCRSLLAYSGSLPFLDAGPQSPGIRRGHLQQRDACCLRS